MSLFENSEQFMGRSLGQGLMICFLSAFLDGINGLEIA